MGQQRRECDDHHGEGAGAPDRQSHDPVTSVGSCRTVGAAKLLGDERLGGNGEHVERERDQGQHAHCDLVGCERRLVGSGSERRRPDQHHEHRRGAQQQVPPGVQQRAHLAPARLAPGGGPDVTADDRGERGRGQHLGDHRRPGRAGHAEVESEHEHHLEHGVERVGREQDHHRRAVVGHAALEALGAEHEDDRGQADRGDAQVRRGEVEDLARPAEHAGEPRCGRRRW